ncbi:MAG TPA: ATP-binding cassette domain-containing protein [Catenuloplanes sp.]|jgi:ABC-type lipoprotein export system ATPase subunit
MTTAADVGKRVTGTGLGHRFPGTAYLFQALDFELRPGRIVGLCGPSGSGKSTLLSILAGWVVPTEGVVRMTGVRRTGWVFQNPYGVPGRSALDHVCLPLLAKGQSRRQATRRAGEVLERFRLTGVGHQPFRELSGGEAQRLMLARALCSAPDLLLVDEPTAQLDISTAATVNDTLGAIAQDGTIVVIATHDPHTRAACTEVIDLSARALREGDGPGAPGAAPSPGGRGEVGR